MYGNTFLPPGYGGGVSGGMSNALWNPMAPVSYGGGYLPGMPGMQMPSPYLMPQGMPTQGYGNQGQNPYAPQGNYAPGMPQGGGQPTNYRPPGQPGASPTNALWQPGGVSNARPQQPYAPPTFANRPGNASPFTNARPEAPPSFLMR